MYDDDGDPIRVGPAKCRTCGADIDLDACIYGHPVEKPAPAPARKRLSFEQASAIEDEMRRLEADPAVSKNQLRLFMQGLMPCGHSVGELLTCPDPPFGCVQCNAEQALEDELGRCYGVILKRLGACSVEPLDEWLDRYLGSVLAVAADQESHHEEHHAREEAVRDFGRRVERLCASVVNYDTVRLGSTGQDAGRAFAEVRALVTDVRSAALALAAKLRGGP